MILTRKIILKKVNQIIAIFFPTFVALLCYVVSSIGASACHSYMTSNNSMFLLRNRFNAHKDYGHSLFSWMAKQKVSRKKGLNLFFF